jgi:hypothetical protein
MLWSSSRTFGSSLSSAAKKLYFFSLVCGGLEVGTLCCPMPKGIVEVSIRRGGRLSGHHVPPGGSVSSALKGMVSLGTGLPKEFLTGWVELQKLEVEREE